MDMLQRRSVMARKEFFCQHFEAFAERCFCIRRNPGLKPGATGCISRIICGFFWQSASHSPF